MPPPRGHGGPPRRHGAPSRGRGSHVRSNHSSYRRRGQSQNPILSLVVGLFIGLILLFQFSRVLGVALLVLVGTIIFAVYKYKNNRAEAAETERILNSDLEAYEDTQDLEDRYR